MNRQQRKTKAKKIKACLKDSKKADKKLREVLLVWPDWTPPAHVNIIGLKPSSEFSIDDFIKKSVQSRADLIMDAIAREDKE